MIQTQNLTPNGLIKLAEQMIEKGYNKDVSSVAVLVTTTEYVVGVGDKIISQAIVPCVEVKL